MTASRLRQTVRVPASAAGTPLLDYLAARFPYHGRDAWAAKVDAGEVQVDGARVHAWTALRRGAEISYEREHREPAVPLEAPVLARGDGWLAVDKPPGLPVHADGAFVRHTLVHQLGLQQGGRVHPAHRLDRETSGVLLLGTEPRRGRELQALFQGRAVRKVYLAVVAGRVADDALGLCDPIGHAQGSEIAIRRACRPDGQPAHTDVRVRARGRTCSLVEAIPHTGRTHQIRVHLEAIGHPVVGDVLYGRPDADYLRWLRHVKAGGDPAWPEGRPVPHHLLHAAALTFTLDGVEHTVRAEPPAAFRAFLEEDGA